MEHSLEVQGGVESQFLNVCDRIDEAVNMLNSGGLVDMKQIEESVKDLCGTIQKLPVNEARGYLPKLQVLTQHLEGISMQLAKQKAQVENDIEQLEETGSAFSAYNHASNLRND